MTNQLPAEIENKRAPALQFAAQLVVKSEADIITARNGIQTIKALRDEIDGHFDPLIKGAHDQHKALLTKKREFTGPLDEAEAQVKTKINGYLSFVEEEQRKQADRLAEIAAKEKARMLEQISKKLDKALCTLVSLGEQRVKLEEMLDEAETDEERQSIQMRLRPILAKINTVEAEAARKQMEVETAAIVTPVTPEPKGIDVAGVSSRVEYVPTRVVNMNQLLMAIRDGKVPVTAIQADMSVIKKLRNMGMDIPGVEFDVRRITSVRRAS